MGGKHKKVLRSEKAKVKLKGAKLPKGLNVTKTDFKVKKIVIREQLQEGLLEDGKFKYSVKETLTRIKHHNTTMRLDGLRTLKDVITSRPEDVFRHLGSIIQGICAISVDIEQEPRRESIKVLSTLLGSLSAETLQPFFHIISSYLRCAMTHIQTAIQEDSLLFLDALLTHLPKLVAANSDKIFADFLDMISKLRADSRPGRTLTVNLGNKTTTIKWRSKVLDRLRGMLKTIIDYKKTSGHGRVQESQAYPVTNRFVLAQPQHFPLLRTSLNANCNLHEIFNRSVGAGHSSDECEVIQGYIEHLMPLLFESWLEVGPTAKEDENTFKTQLVLSHDAASTLKIVLEIFTHLWELTELLDRQMNNEDLSQWLKDEYASEFSSHFLRYFPYQQSEGSGLSKKKSKNNPTDKDVHESGGQYCLPQNLTICYLFCALNRESIASANANTTAILNYLNNTLKQRNATSSAETFPILEKSLREILFTNSRNFIKNDGDKVKSLLAAVLENFEKGHFARDTSNTRILSLLCDIVSSQELCRFYGSKTFENWLPNLPELLLKPTINHSTLLTLSKLAKQKNEVFLKSLRGYTNSVIENISSIQAIGSENQFEGKKLIMNLFYWFQFEADERRSFDQLIDNAAFKDKRLAPYFKSIVGEEFYVC